MLPLADQLATLMQQHPGKLLLIRAADYYFRTLKHKYPDKLLLFHFPYAGGYYGSYGEDAITLAKELNLTLVKSSGVEIVGGQADMAKFPLHSLEENLQKLIAAGIKVAVCEMMS